MSKLQELVDANEMDYQFAIIDIRNAIETYGIELPDTNTLIRRSLRGK